MGNKIFKRVFAMCLAMVLMVASSLAVMAAETTSPGGGDVVPDPVIPTRTTTVVTKTNSIEVKYTQKNDPVKYRVQWKSAEGTWDHCRTKTVTDLSYIISKLAAGGRYDIRVCGINEEGKAGAYCTVASRFIRSCSATVTATNGGFKVKVSKANKNVTGYKIYWTNDSTFGRFNVMTVNGTTLNKFVAGKKGKTYYVRVVPISSVGETTYNGVQNATHTVKTK